MITITTFLRSGDGCFRLVDSCADPPVDTDYIEGAIELSVDGVEIIGKREWDYVDQLWAYMATMTRTISLEARADTYFPDQPILLAFERRGSRVVVSSKIGDETRRASADLGELLSVIRAAGVEFFGQMSRLAPANARSYGVARAELRD